MPQNEPKKLQAEYFTEVTDHDLREMLNHHMPEQFKEKYRIVSLTWCVNTKKWLIKAVRKADVQQASAQA